MYYTGLDPMTGEAVYVARGGHERRLQRALLQFFKPENYADVREAVESCGREDLIGAGPNCLIPSRPPKVVSSEKPRHSRQAENRTPGYRPHRKTARRRK